MQYVYMNLYIYTYLYTDEMSWPFGKDPDAGNDWGQEEKGMTEG